MRDCANLWTRTEAAGIEFLLTGSFGLADFNALLVELLAAYAALRKTPAGNP